MATQTVTLSNEVLYPASNLPVKVTGMQAVASRMWKPFIAMGFMIVLAAFIVGLVNSNIGGDYYSAWKAVREAAEQGSELATQKAFIEATKAWLPALKFLGIGMLLGGVTFLLAMILGALRVGGGRVQEALGVEVKLIVPPITVKLFPMILMAALGIGVALGVLSYDFWNHSVANELNTASEGSALLARLGTINAVKLWLEPFKFVGMAFLLTGIGLALATIVRLLRWQSTRLWDILS